MWQCSISKSRFVGRNDKQKYTMSPRIWRRCRLRDNMGSTASRALDVVGSGRTMVLQARGRCGSMASWAWEQCKEHNIAGSGRTMLLQAQEQRCGLGDDAYVVDGVTGSGRRTWWRVRATTLVGNIGAEAPRRTQWWRGGFGENSTTVWALMRSTTAQAPGKFW
jgi:hypothetical protein